MKKLHVIFICLFFKFLALAQNRYHVTQIVCPKNEEITYLKYNMTPINGVVYCEYGDMGKYMNGLKEGIHFQWAENGNLWTKCNFTNGKEDGLHQWWFKEGGEIMIEASYSNGKANGIHRWWAENGQLMMEESYKLGKRDGLWRTFHENGVLDNQIVYINDKIADDRVEYFDYQGQNFKTEYYSNGILINCTGNCIP